MANNREQLAAILGMMGSAHDGEIANAARHAERLRKQMGKSWAELLSSSPSPTPPPPPTGSNPAVGVYVVANMISRQWEYFRIPHIDGTRGNLTPQQVEQEVGALAKEIVRAYEVNDIGAMNHAASRIWLLTGETLFCVDLDLMQGKHEVTYEAYPCTSIQDAIKQAGFVFPVRRLKMMAKAIDDWARADALAKQEAWAREEEEEAWEEA